MVSENDDIADNEHVLRRILNDTAYINLALPQPLQRQSFRPTEWDVKGISVFRELFVTPEVVATSGRNSKGYYVIRRSVQELQSIGIDIVPDPGDMHLPGHCYVPQITLSDPRKDLQGSLARLVNLNIEERIVYRPT